MFSSCSHGFQDVYTLGLKEEAMLHSDKHFPTYLLCWDLKFDLKLYIFLVFTFDILEFLIFFLNQGLWEKQQHHCIQFLFTFQTVSQLGIHLE